MGRFRGAGIEKGLRKDGWSSEAWGLKVSWAALECY